MAGRLDAKTVESSGPLTAAIAAAWIFQGLLLGGIAWLVLGEPMYWAFADGMSVQSQLVLIAALPALLSGYWLAERGVRRFTDALGRLQRR
jgi:hypothetical protein